MLVYCKKCDRLVSAVARGPHPNPLVIADNPRALGWYPVPHVILEGPNAGKPCDGDKIAP